jgi:ABC-2 type transport system permease protein
LSKDIVKGKIIAILILEAFHIIVAFFFGIIHNMIYGQMNFFLDINIAFFGLILILFAVFNLVFFTLYYKSGYYYGKPVIYAIAAAMVYGFLIEFVGFKYQWARDIIEGDFSTQLIVLVIGVVVTVVMSLFTIKRSIHNYVSVS